MNDNNEDVYIISQYDVYFDVEMLIFVKSLIPLNLLYETMKKPLYLST